VNIAIFRNFVRYDRSIFRKILENLCSSFSLFSIVKFMKPFLITGLTNMETNLKIEGFPLSYYPVTFPFYGIQTHTSGVGVNLSLALMALGRKVKYLSMLGEDLVGKIAREEMEGKGIDCGLILPLLRETPSSVILREESGRRQIHCDLKNIQETPYPETVFFQTLQEVDMCVLTPINFSRPFLKKSRELGKTVVTDLHVIKDLDDEYNRDFLENAHILFLSNEEILGREEEFIREASQRYPFEIGVVGMGAQGSLLYDRQRATIQKVGVYSPRDLVNTIGAGDALFSAFLHFWAKGLSPLEALRRASYFAGWKVGENGAAQGFLSQEEVEKGVS